MSQRLPLLLLAASALSGCASHQDFPQGNVPPGRVNAVGAVPCSHGEADLDETCAFRMARDASGGIRIWIASPAWSDRSISRLLHFRQGTFELAGGGHLEVGHYDRDWLITINWREHYRLPRALTDSP